MMDLTQQDLQNLLAILTSPKFEIKASEAETLVLLKLKLNALLENLNKKPSEVKSEEKDTLPVKE